MDPEQLPSTQTTLAFKGPPEVVQSGSETNALFATMFPRVIAQPLCIESSQVRSVRIFPGPPNAHGRRLDETDAQMAMMFGPVHVQFSVHAATPLASELLVADLGNSVAKSADLPPKTVIDPHSVASAPATSSPAKDCRYLPGGKLALPPLASLGHESNRSDVHGLHHNFASNETAAQMAVMVSVA